MSGRAVLLVTHPGRPAAVSLARQAAAGLSSAGIEVRVLAEEAERLSLDDAEVVPADQSPAAGCELVVVLGGDGTILRGAELAAAAETAVIGINMGHVGFLAEAEYDALDHTVQLVVDRAYSVQERMTLDVVVKVDGGVVATGWALNEATVEKASRERMLELVVEIDGRPLSRLGCDGVVCATPTGSTAYAFSAGGPVVWPEVAALLLVPISAHALFARPLVTAPTSVLALEVLAHTDRTGVLWCDGRRTVDLPPGARIEVCRGTRPVRLAQLHRSPFTDRLVAKFDLPVQGWRGGPADVPASG